MNMTLNLVHDDAYDNINIMNKKYTPVRGTYDLISTEKYAYILNTFMQHMRLYAFNEIKLPILEHKHVYLSAGSDSDVVSKEMFCVSSSSADEADSDIVLRAEGTASCLRAVANAGLRHQSSKFYYTGSMFRYNRPQKDRYREFTQLGCEYINPYNTLCDYEVIECIYTFLQKLNLSLTININTLCSKETMHQYTTNVHKFLEEHVSCLSIINQNRLSYNVLRVIDQLTEEEKKALPCMPNIIDFATSDERADFAALCAMLVKMNLNFIIDPFIVRGLDYYRGAVYEIFIEGQNKAIAGGGSYKGYADIHGSGWAIGVERIMDYVTMPQDIQNTTYALCALNTDYAMTVANILRNRDYQIDIVYGATFTECIKKASIHKPQYIIICDDSDQQSKSIRLRNWNTRSEKSINIEDISNIDLVIN